MKTYKQSSCDDPVVLTIYSVALGVIVTLLMIIWSNGDKIVDIVGGMTVTILTLQISELWRHRQLAPRLSSLERAATNDVLYKILVNQIDAVEQINLLKGQYPRSSSFVEERLNEAFGRLGDVLQTLCQGRINIDKEWRELTSNTDFLLQLPERSVRAVSYQDEEFWDEPEGVKFLNAHKKVLDERVQVARIFILPESHLDGQRELIMRQVGLGISCYIIMEEKLDQQFREDFVLYDDCYVRFAQLVAHTATNTLKHATLTRESDKLREYVDKYEYLEARSVDANAFYERRTIVSPGSPQ